MIKTVFILESKQGKHVKTISVLESEDVIIDVYVRDNKLRVVLTDFTKHITEKILKKRSGCIYLPQHYDPLVGITRPTLSRGEERYVC